MAEKNRNFSIFLLVLALVGAALFYGCGSATSDSVPAIEYSITGQYASAGLTSVSVASARAVSGLSAGILIYSESDPTNYADIDVDNKTFLLKNLKPGIHYLVFKHIPNGINGTSYIYRATKPVTLTESLPVQELNEVLRAEEGTIAITGKITQPNGQPIVPTPTLTLWGQTIDVNPSTGEFTTPKMPEGTKADLIVNAINYQKTTTPVVFEENPAYYEVTGVDTTSNDLPPTVRLTSKNSTYNIKSVVILTAVAEDPNNDELDFVWEIESCTSENPGSLEFSQETVKGNVRSCEYYWNAPEYDCLATISVKVVEKNTLQKLSAKSKLKLQIGNGRYKPNTKPQIISTEISPTTLYGNRNYTITLVATDTDGDVLNHFLTISPNAGSLQKSTGNSWTWRTPDINEAASFELNFEVRDLKGNTATTSRTISVNPTQVNEPPVILSLNPADTTDLMSGTEISLVITAKDPENEKLTFRWISSSGEIKGASQSEGTASITWGAPYLNNPAVKEIGVIVSDPYGDSASATFSINVVPDPNKKAPEIEITISGTTATYNGIPLFKSGETVLFTGLATDSNFNQLLSESHYIWELNKPDSSNYELLANATSSASFVANGQTQAGEYMVRMKATDNSGITGENFANFRINTIPTVSILCNGNSIGTDGRMTTPTAHSYTNSGKTYDVFQLGDSVSFVANCEDMETDTTTLENNARWVHGSSPSVGKNYNVANLTSSGLNTLQLATIDSKGESSATATYQFFVNKPPVFQIATSTKTGFLNTDLITLNAVVNDDANGLEMTWYVSSKPDGDGAVFSDYQTFDVSGSNPVISSTNTISSKIEISAATLLTQGKDFKFRLIATDSMGVQTVNEDIVFSIVSSHQIKDFNVASGAYYSNKEPFRFEDLAGYPEPYDFEAKQVFSMKSGSNIWENSMTWTWYDIYWTNNKPGSPTKIDTKYIDSSAGYILNGYSVEDKFGTHTIMLEGKSIDYGIVASNSIDIFVNSTPKIEFKSAASGTMRFDTGSNATFTVTLKEDDKNERLGLAWTIYDLSRNCEEVESTKTIYFSHDLDDGTGDKTPIYMAGVNEKTVTINWSDISSDSLASGAKRVYVCAFDPYGKAATATIDILVNTLPVFTNVIGERKIKIQVPDYPTDSAENYQYFKEQYATTTSNIPIFLVAGNPSMQLDFTADALDSEYPNFFNEHEDNIIWKYTNEKGQEMSTTGKNIKGRFGIGSNTVNVECRDFFYNYYSKDGDNTIYNNMCIATCSEDFYLWQSMAWELEDSPDSLYTATAMYLDGNNHFLITYKEDRNSDGVYDGLASYSRLMEISAGVNTSCFTVVPTENYLCLELFKQNEDGPGYNSFDPKRFYQESPRGIITMLQQSESTFILLTDSASDTLPIVETPVLDENGNPTGEVKRIQTFVKYSDSITDKEYYIPVVGSYTAIKLALGDGGDEAMANNSAYRGFNNGDKTIYLDRDDVLYGPTEDTHKAFPGGSEDFPKRILSMTFCDKTDPTAGAMLLHNWNKNGGTVDALAAYKNDRLWFLDENNSNPLYGVDGTTLSFTQDSKVRYLTGLTNTSQQLFITDTGRDRLIRCSSAFTDATSIPASSPIDICTTKSKYVFSLANSGETGITLYAIDDASATPLTRFAKFVDSNNNDFNYRAGKVKNPKSIIYYTLQNGDNYFGGLIILEEGITEKNRIQLIRSNKADWLE